MTRSQKLMIEHLDREVENQITGRRGEYEVKERRVKEFSTFVSYYVYIGYKGDENSILSLYRDTIHLFIGKRGGVTYYPNKGNVDKHKRYKGNLWQVIIDQNHMEV